MIERHFLFKAVQEVHEQLKKNKEGFLIDFSSKLHEFFNQQLLLYWQMEGFITEDDLFTCNIHRCVLNMLILHQQQALIILNWYTQ